MPENDNFNPLVNASIKFDINKMKAHLRLHINDSGRPLEASLVEELIKQSGIVYGLRKTLLMR
jgi:hypothetical protein